MPPGIAQLIEAIQDAVEMALLRARHLPQSIGGHSIGIKERDQWLACMDQAMGETGVPEDLRARLRDSFFQTADWMRNRGE